MNVVGSLKINKWHIVSYIHYGSLHIKPSPMVEFNGKFNVIEKSEECSVLGLPYERQFHGSLRLRMAKQTTFFKENKTPDILTGIQGAGSHRYVQCAITPWVADDIIVALVPAHQPGRLWSTHFSLRTYIWTLSPTQFACSIWKVSVGSDHAQKPICRYVHHQIVIVL